MGEFSDMLLGRNQQPQDDASSTMPEGPGRFARLPQNAASGGQAVSFSDMLLGPKSSPQDVQREDKSITDDSSKALGFIDQAKGSFASDNDEWVRYAAKSLYPNEPIDKAAKRFGRTKEGNFYHTDDAGNSYFVQPYSGTARLANIGSGVGAALPVAAGTATGIVTAPMAATGVGLAGTIGLTGSAAAAGEIARQKIGDWLLGDAATNSVSAPSVVSEAVHNGLGQGIGLGFGRWLQRYAVPDVAQYSQPAANRLADIAERNGIRLTPAELTGLESLTADQKRLMAVPQSANIMRNFTTERNREAYGAFRGMLDRIAPAQDAAVLGRQGGELADDMVRAAQSARTAAVNPFYTQAEREIGAINTQPVVDFIQQELPYAKGSIRRALETAQRELMVTGTQTPDTSFRGLNNAKLSIDALLSDPELAARQGIDRTAYGMLSEVRQRLVSAIDGAAGNSGAYRAGREAYAAITQRDVAPMEQALQPFLMANRDNANLMNVAQRLLDPQSRSPQQIAHARRLIEAQSPETWNSFLRQYLTQETAGALRTMAQGDLRNVGGGVSKALGSEPMMENLRAAMSPRQFQEFTDLMDVFRAAARTMDANSDTAMKTEMIKRAKNDAGGAIARTIRNINPARALENAAEFFADRNYVRQSEALARIITSGDRDAILAMRQLRQFGPSDWRRYAIVGHLLERTGVAGAEAALD